MPIEGVSNIVRMPRLGKIHLGIKVERPGKHPYPQATDYFVVPDEVADIFGEKPKELEIMFPIEDSDQFAQQWYRCYSMTQGLVCIGDGVSSRRKFDLKTGAIAGRDTKAWEWKEGWPCDPQECPEYLSKRCRRVMNLQVLIPQVPGLGVWQIDTSSFYSIVNINSMIKLLKNLAGRCSFIPLTLALGPIEVTPPGQTKKTVHIMHIKKDMKLADIARIALLPPGQVLIPEPETEEAPADLIPAEVLAEAEESSEEDRQAVEHVLDEELPLEGVRIIERDVSLIKNKNDFAAVCFQDFELQPEEARKKTGFSSWDEIGSWGDAYLNVAGTMGAKVIEPAA